MRPPNDLHGRSIQLVTFGELDDQKNIKELRVDLKY